MSLRAVVYMDASELILGDTARKVPEAKLKVEQQSNVDSFFVSVESDAPGAVEAAMTGDPAIEDFWLASEYGRRRVYQVEFDVERQLVSEMAADLGINLRSTRSPFGEVGWTFEMELPDREALVEFREYCRRKNLGFELRRLSTVETPESEKFGLSPKQRETLLLGYEHGYFDVPRGISQQELADIVGTSPTAVSQRLRRATKTLVGETVGAAAEENTGTPDGPHARGNGS